VGNFKAGRIKIEGITFDLDKPICDPVWYQTTRRMKKDDAVQRLVNQGYLNPGKEFKRQKVKEDAVISALKKIGGIFIKV